MMCMSQVIHRSIIFTGMLKFDYLTLNLHCCSLAKYFYSSFCAPTVKSFLLIGAEEREVRKKGGVLKIVSQTIGLGPLMSVSLLSTPYHLLNF